MREREGGPRITKRNARTSAAHDENEYAERPEGDGALLRHALLARRLRGLAALARRLGEVAVLQAQVVLGRLGGGPGSRSGGKRRE